MTARARISPRWRQLLEERLAEAAAALGSVPGVRGLIVGGSMGRGEPWPLSDIDMLPISRAGSETAEEVQRWQSTLVDWWAASGRAQTLDVSWLRFTDDEVEQAMRSGAAGAALRMSELRWFHGFDKSYGGRGAADPDGLAEAFARWVTELRFDPAVVAARIGQWRMQLDDARKRAADAMGRDDREGATLALREAARALRMVLIEGWGERLGSMGREWTRFERMAKRHGEETLAARIAVVADANAQGAVRRAATTPAWVQERVELAYAARREVGERVTEEESARDQLAAFAIHVPRHRPKPWGEWLRLPDPALEAKLAELDELIAAIGT